MVKEDEVDSRSERQLVELKSTHDLSRFSARAAEGEQANQAVETAPCINLRLILAISG
jgi:hypothetical protein